jgi:hypothetical protein
VASNRRHICRAALSRGWGVRVKGLLLCLIVAFACGWAAPGIFPITPMIEGFFVKFHVDRVRGIDFIQLNSPTTRKHLIEAMGGGVALLDYNNDGLLDIFLINGGRIANPTSLLQNFDRHNPKYWNRLYRQNRDGGFTDVTEQAGLANVSDSDYGMGVAVGDFDNDGYPDLYVTNYGRNILYHNNGNGTFTDVTETAGVAAGGWSASAGFFDFDNDGRLDLFVTRYVVWDESQSKPCGNSPVTYCPPGVFPATTNILYHNLGNGRFADVSDRSGIAAKKARSLGVAFADYDGDGFTDIFVANDAMEQFLFHNNGDGTFSDRALEAGTALSADGGRYAGMGVVFQDYDNDGLPDIIVTNLAKQTYALYHNDGHGLFSYRSLEAALGSLSSGSSGWGLGLEDFDNDGWKDMFVAQGHVLDNVQELDPTLRYREAPLVAMNRRGRFERADVGINEMVAGRGAAFGDFNNDGWCDAVENVLGGRPLVMLNGKGSNHWLVINLIGTRSNRDGFGARVQVNDQERFATSAGSYLSASDKRLHFGLGTSETATIKILWPSGIHQVLKDVPADQFLVVHEPSGAP